MSHHASTVACVFLSFVALSAEVRAQDSEGGSPPRTQQQRLPPRPPVAGSASPDPEARTARNAVYLELGGPGLAYSLNYERYILNDVSLRMGGSYMVWGTSGSAGHPAWWLAFPIMLNFLGVYAGSHALDLGGGLVMIYCSTDLSSICDDDGLAPKGGLSLGYRFAPADGGFLFRAAITPLFNFSTKTSEKFPFVSPWGGLSFGAAF